MKKKRVIKALLILVLVLAIGVGIALFTRVKIPMDCAGQIRVYTRNKPDAELTIAVIKDGKTDVRAYGHDGEELEPSGRSYELGPVADTFAGELAANAVIDGNMGMNSKANDYVAFSTSVYAPTIYELITHTSAYGDYAKDVTGRDNVVQAAENFRLNSEPPYLYMYSPFGVRMLKLVLEAVYETEYTALQNDFTSAELGLEHTAASTLGAVSTVDDMIKYAGIIMDPPKNYIRESTEPLIEVNMETHIAFMWNVDENGIIGSSGESDEGAAAIRIDRNSGTAVIVLSNYGNDRYGSISNIADAVMSENK